MTGAGSLPAGIGPAGQAPVTPASSTSAAPLPHALNYNEGTFAFEPDTNQYGSITPMEQRVRLALLQRRGAVPVAPTQGFDWTTRFESGDKLAADVADRLHDALSRAGIVVGVDIDEVRIEVSSNRTAGRVGWVYTFKDLSTGAGRANTEVMGNG